VNYLESNKLINDSQLGFRRGRSCLTNLLIFLDKVTRQVDEGNHLDVIYLDFAKAFDRVPSVTSQNATNRHQRTSAGLDYIMAEEQEAESWNSWQLLKLDGSDVRCAVGVSSRSHTHTVLDLHK